MRVALLLHIHGLGLGVSAIAILKLYQGQYFLGFAHLCWCIFGAYKTSDF